MRQVTLQSGIYPDTKHDDSNRDLSSTSPSRFLPSELNIDQRSQLLGRQTYRNFRFLAMTPSDFPIYLMTNEQRVRTDAIS